MTTTDSQPTTSPTMSGIDLATCVTSVASLLASAGVSSIILPSIGDGFHWLEGWIVGVVLLVQVAALLLVVALSSLALSARKRPSLSHTAKWLLGLAIAGVIVEGISLLLIPNTGIC